VRDDAIACERRKRRDLRSEPGERARPARREQRESSLVVKPFRRRYPAVAKRTEKRDICRRPTPFLHARINEWTAWSIPPARPERGRRCAGDGR
jgi:hypothetical protein